MASKGLLLESQMRVAGQPMPSFSGRRRLEGKSSTVSSVRRWKSLKVAMTTSPPRQRKETVDTTRHHQALTPQYRPRSHEPEHVPREKLEVIASLDTWAQESLLSLLKSVSKSWQPQDFLLEASSDSFFDEVWELRARAKELPDDYLVCLVGDMITEEALPTYQTMFNTFEGVRDRTGCSPTPWSVWIRAWTAEENRHGVLLNRYLYLSGRVDMRMVERTTQYLIGSRHGTSPYPYPHPNIPQPLHPTDLDYLLTQATSTSCRLTTSQTSSTSQEYHLGIAVVSSGYYVTITGL